MEIEYVDDDDLNNDNISVKKDAKLPVNNGIKKDIDVDKYVTNTKGYNPSSFNIVSPEEIEKANQAREAANPNEEFREAVEIIEKTQKRKLTQEEYLKVADSYATILAERDEERRKNYEGKYQINPIKKEKYFKLLLENKPVTNAMRELVKDYEDAMIAPIMTALDEAQRNQEEYRELKKDKRVNIRYKGKCRIASDEGGKVIIIDNKEDVNLLHMKYRKEWIEKKYPDHPEITGKAQLREDDGEFV